MYARKGVTIFSARKKYPLESVLSKNIKKDFKLSLDKCMQIRFYRYSILLKIMKNIKIQSDLHVEITNLNDHVYYIVILLIQGNLILFYN